MEYVCLLVLILECRSRVSKNFRVFSVLRFVEIEASG